MTREDLEREHRIELALYDLVAANDSEQRRKFADVMRIEINQRSPEQRERMEKARGLRRE